MAQERERWECPSCGTPLNIAALGIYAKIACPACGHVDRVHTMLANYRIEGVLGLGGMSVVLRARDLVLERPLAIKLLNEFYRDQPERMARFEQECELMAKVCHENVVSVYSAGRVRGQFYIAMELVNGRNLEELVRDEGSLDPLHALDVLRQVVDGLSAAFNAGLLHRDMKPANILICEDGQAKVLDFGLSHGKRDAETEEIIWATPYYVPPETLMREAEDARADIYALGMTMRHVLSGQGQFDSAPETIEDMLACKKALPRMAEALPGLPEAYCDLLDHMTAYDAASRPENYASLLEEIAEVRAALVAEQCGASFKMRLKRSLPLLAGAVATLVLGAGGAAVAAWLATPEPEHLCVSPAANLPWHERDTLAAAMTLLQAAEHAEAMELLAQLSDSEGEPAACAWAALHVSLLAGLQGDEEQAGCYQKRLEHHLKRTPAPAGRELHEQMVTMLQPLAEPDHNVLQARLILSRLESAINTCQEQEVKRNLQAARAALRGAGAAYAPMVNLLQKLEKKLRQNLPERAEYLYLQSLALLNMPEATRAFDLMGGAASDEAGRARLAVQKEALALFVDAVEMMKRRSLMPHSGEQVTAESLHSLLRPLGKPTLAVEIATLMLVARGEFEAAAVQNPYAQSPHSAEPFAVMMRDWFRRVK